MCPTSAPPTRVQQQYGREQNVYAGQENQKLGRGMPHTAVGGSFPGNQRYAINANGQMYALPEVLSPPELRFGESQEDMQMDPEVYAEMLATNQYLAQQQMRLQQQLLDLTAAQQQMQGMNLGSGMGQHSQYVQPAMAPSHGCYNQQLRETMQPVVTAVPGTPGLYTVYNPMTGQTSCVVDDQAQALAQDQAQASPQLGSPNQDLSHSPPPATPEFRAQVSPPPESNLPVRIFRSPSPQKTDSPSLEPNPLPPPSATAFRRGHHKQLSSVTGFASRSEDGPKSGVPKSAGFPQTPMTGTFGPGQARAGDHPVRQPRGPPSLEELVQKPTSNHEGSKNFVTRQRRRAVNNLVRAGMERRGASRGSNSIDGNEPLDSAGSGTPSSECDITFSISSESDSESSPGSRSGKGSPTVNSMRRSPPIGAIGSERKETRSRSRERHSTGIPWTTVSVSREEGGIGGKMVEVKMNEGRRSAPLLVLTSAEKRKSAIF